MKSPLNILSLALVAAALTVLPACKAAPKDAPAPEPAPAVAQAPAEKSYSWFAKKGQRRGGKAEAAAATAEWLRPGDWAVNAAVVAAPVAVSTR